MIESSPLQGCTVVSTRPAGDGGGMSAALEAAGARVIAAPAIELASLVDANIDAAKQVLEAIKLRGGWLVLPSPAAVRFCGEAVARLEIRLDGVRIAVVGPGSGEALARLGYSAGWVAPQGHGEALAESLPFASGEPIAIMGSGRTRAELREGLEGRGAKVHTIALYEPRPSGEGLARLRESIQSAGACIVLVASPSAVEAIAEHFAESRCILDRVGWLSIGGTTARALRESGREHDAIAEAEDPNAAGIVRAARGLFKRMRGEGRR